MKRAARACCVVVVVCGVVYGAHVVEVVGGFDRAGDHDGCAIVLGAGVDVDVPSPVFAGRLDHAVDLASAGVVDLVACTGGTGDGDRVAEAAACGVYVKDRVDVAVVLEATSTTTRENLQNVKPLLGPRRCLLISDDLHLPRALVLATDAGVSVTPSPTPHTKLMSTSIRARFAAREAWYLLQHRARQQLTDR